MNFVFIMVPVIKFMFKYLDFHKILSDFIFTDKHA